MDAQLSPQTHSTGSHVYSSDWPGQWFSRWGGPWIHNTSITRDMQIPRPHHRRTDSEPQCFNQPSRRFRGSLTLESQCLGHPTMPGRQRSGTLGLKESIFYYKTNTFLASPLPGQLGIPGVLVPGYGWNPTPTDEGPDLELWGGVQVKPSSNSPQCLLSSFSTSRFRAQREQRAGRADGQGEDSLGNRSL